MLEATLPHLVFNNRSDFHGNNKIIRWDKDFFLRTVIVHVTHHTMAEFLVS